VNARRYTWLLFDADGTLFDYDTAEAGALRRAFESLRVPFQPAYLGVYKRVNKRMWEEFELGAVTAAMLRTKRFALLSDEIGIPFDPDAFSGLYLRFLSESADLTDGAEGVVRALHPRHKLALVTNGLTEVQRSRFSRAAIRDCISVVVISDEIGAAKPHPAFFDIAFERMNQPDRNTVLMIGDSLTSDIRGGSDYGIDTCWFNPNSLPRPADLPITYEIHALPELLSICR